MSIGPFVQLRRRRSFFQLNGIKEEPYVADIPVDVSTDEKSLETLHDKYQASKPSSTMIWGVPLQSILLLNIAAVLWGTQHSVIKSVVDGIPIGPSDSLREWFYNILGREATFIPSNDGDAAAYFTLARFSLAALLAAPYTPGVDEWLDRLKGRVNTGETKIISMQDDSLEMVNEPSIDNNLSWKYGIELGIYMFLGYAFQAVGLQTTTASRSGFLLYLNVKLVPFFAFLLFGKTIRASTWISALVAFIGTALLTLDNSGDGLSFGLNAGDLWSIAAAAASAMFILRTEEASKAVTKSSELNAASLWTVSLLAALWTLTITSKNVMIDMDIVTNAQVPLATVQYTVIATLSTFINHPLQMFYLSAVTTTLANYIQSKGQKDISAERASIIYAMDPVYGALAANLLLGEQLGTLGSIGCGLIFTAAATNALFDFGPAGDD